MQHGRDARLAVRTKERFVFCWRAESKSIRARSPSVPAALDPFHNRRPTASSSDGYHGVAIAPTVSCHPGESCSSPPNLPARGISSGLGHLPGFGRKCPLEFYRAMQTGQQSDRERCRVLGDQASNPFLHTYHPDHERPGCSNSADPAPGGESLRVTRLSPLIFGPPGMISTPDPGQKLDLVATTPKSSPSRGESVAARRQYNVLGPFPETHQRHSQPDSPIERPPPLPHEIFEPHSQTMKTQTTLLLRPLLPLTPPSSHPLVLGCGPPSGQAVPRAHAADPPEEPYLPGIPGGWDGNPLATNNPATYHGSLCPASLGRATGGPSLVRQQIVTWTGQFQRILAKGTAI